MDELKHAIGRVAYAMLVKAVRHISISIDHQDKTVTVWRKGKPTIIETRLIEDFVNGTN